VSVTNNFVRKKKLWERKRNSWW